MRRVRAVLLCEDLQHEVFVRRFFKKHGWDTRWWRVERAPPGRGSAEQFVRKQYPVELTALRRLGRQETALAVMIDGDEKGLAGRHKDLLDACRSAGVEPRRPSERVLVFVPTWSIESWLAYLDGQDVEESEHYPRLTRESDCQPHVNALAEMCSRQELRAPAPESLRAACKEYGRLSRSRN